MAEGAPATANCTENLLRRWRLLGFFVVGIDNPRDKRVAHHVGGCEIGEGDTTHAGENAPRLYEAAFLPAPEIDLRDVAGNYRLGAEADASEEHLHLLGGGILRFIQDDE